MFFGDLAFRSATAATMSVVQRPLSNSFLPAGVLTVFSARFAYVSSVPVR